MKTEAYDFLINNFGLLFDAHEFKIISEVSNGRKGSSICIASSHSNHMVIFVAFDRNRPSLIIGDGRTISKPTASYATLDEGKWYGSLEIRKLLDVSFSIKNAIHEMPEDTKSIIQFSDQNLEFIRDHIYELALFFSDKHIDSAVYKLCRYTEEVSEAYDTLA